MNFTGGQDPVAALNALDIASSCSLFGEGFSNAIAEAMACGLPCIVTDVGDSRAIVGDFGTVVPAGSAAALAAAMQSVIATRKDHDPRLPRQKIVTEFSVSAMVERTLEALQSAAAGERTGRRRSRRDRFLAIRD